MITPARDLDLVELRDAAERVGEEFGCRLIVLFGSTARRDGAVPEDLDFGILGTGPLDAVALTNRLIRELSTQEVDVADLGRADPLLLFQVARDGIPLYEGRPGEFARFTSLAVRRYADTRKFRDMERQELHDRLRGGFTSR
jgi:predicted nucleotidyltransferase